MPETDGFEATAAIRVDERHAGRYTLIVALARMPWREIASAVSSICLAAT